MRDHPRHDLSAACLVLACIAWVTPGDASAAAFTEFDRGVTRQEAQGDTAAVRETGEVTFDFQNADLRTVLTALAEASGTNIVYSGLPDRKVTLRTPDPVSVAEVRALLESVVNANGLAITEKDGVVRVYAPDQPASRAAGTGEPEAAAEQPAPSVPPRLFVHRLAHADAATVAQTLRTLFGLEGAGGAPGRAGTVGAASLSERLRDQEAAGYRSFADPRADARPRRAPAGQAPARRPSAQPEGSQEGDQEDGTSVLLQGPVEIVPNDRTNSILVVATPADYEIVTAAVEKLDRRPLQVLIEVLIVEVRRSDNLNISNEVDVPPDGEAGEAGDGGGDEGDGGAGDNAEFGIGGSLSAVGNLALEVLGVGSRDASAVLNVLSQSTDATILSRPVVMAKNNQEARILVGDQRPFVQLSRATEGGAVDQVVQFRNVGTELRIRPTINRDGFVNLEVLQEVSDATQVTQFNAPIINTRESETDVLVRDGHTVVLGGLVDRETERTRSGVPLLKDIPVLGGLFGSTSRREVASELFILLTPHVLHTDADIRDAREQIENSSERLEETLPDPLRLIRMDSVPGDSLPAADSVSARADSVAEVPKDTTSSG